MIEFEYTIKKFDEKNNVVTVEFPGGSWANIALVQPLPRSLLDLDKIVRPFWHPPVEVTENVDLAFIKDNINNKRTISTDLPSSTNQESVSDVTERLAEEEEIRLKAFVEMVLKERGLI